MGELLNVFVRAVTCGCEICVAQHFGTKNNILHERMALFNVLTPFDEKRQDDYQVSARLERGVA